MDYGLDKKSNTLKTFNTIFIISWLLVACFPFIWTFWGSFKVRADFFSRSDWWYAVSAFNTLIELEKNLQQMHIMKHGLRVNFGKHQRIPLSLLYLWLVFHCF